MPSKKQFSYRHGSNFSWLYWCKEYFSCWALQLLSDWKALSKISQWLTTVWKTWFQLQNWVIYCHLTAVGIPKLAVNTPWGHKTRTAWHWDLRLFRRRHGLRKQLFKKMRLSWLRNKIWRETIYWDHLLYRHWVCKSRSWEKKCIRRPKHSCRFLPGTWACPEHVYSKRTSQLRHKRCDTDSSNGDFWAGIPQFL